jgi:hypothetical protein
MEVEIPLKKKRDPLATKEFLRNIRQSTQGNVQDKWKVDFWFEKRTIGRFSGIFLS